MKLSDILKDKEHDNGFSYFISWYEILGKYEIYKGFNGTESCISSSFAEKLGINDDQNLLMINRYLQDDGIEITKKDDAYSFVLLDNI